MWLEKGRKGLMAPRLGVRLGRPGSHHQQLAFCRHSDLPPGSVAKQALGPLPGESGELQNSPCLQSLSSGPRAEPIVAPGQKMTAWFRVCLCVCAAEVVRRAELERLRKRWRGRPRGRETGCTQWPVLAAGHQRLGLGEGRGAGEGRREGNRFFKKAFGSL